MGADAAIVEAATWTAVAAAGCLVLRTRAVVATGTALLIAAGGVAFASGGGQGPRPPAVSVDWPTSSPGGRATAVTVRRGDCLWAIARRHLAHPTPIRVATDWPRWWRTNRGVIGPDPELVLPGQRLRPPASIRSPS